NVWRADLDRIHDQIKAASAKLGDKLWIAPSCSLLHVPIDLTKEEALDTELKSWLSFAVQKLDELRLVKGLLDGDLSEADKKSVEQARQAVKDRAASSRIHRKDVAERMAGAGSINRQRTA